MNTIKLTLLAALLLAPLPALHGAEPPATFCNPLPIPNYPIGRAARTATKGTPDSGAKWLLGHQEQPAQQGIELYAKGGGAKLLSLDLWLLKPIWK